MQSGNRDERALVVSVHDLIDERGSPNPYAAIDSPR